MIIAWQPLRVEKKLILSHLIYFLCILAWANARPHAEMQILSYAQLRDLGPVSKMGISKPACGSCEGQLRDNNVEITPGVKAIKLLVCYW